MVDINELKFDEKGLIPAVMVDVYTRDRKSTRLNSSHT